MSSLAILQSFFVCHHSDKHHSKNRGTALILSFLFISGAAARSCKPRAQLYVLRDLASIWMGAWYILFSSTPCIRDAEGGCLSAQYTVSVNLQHSSWPCYLQMFEKEQGGCLSAKGSHCINLPCPAEKGGSLSSEVCREHGSCGYCVSANQTRELKGAFFLLSLSKSHGWIHPFSFFFCDPKIMLSCTSRSADKLKNCTANGIAVRETAL